MFGFWEFKGEIVNSGLVIKLVGLGWIGKKIFSKILKIRFFVCGFGWGPNIVYVYRKS